MPSSRLPSDVVPYPLESHDPFHHDGWVYEEKVDGWRMLAYKNGTAVELVNRNGRDHTPHLPGLVAAIRDLPASPLIFDGEVAMDDRQLISRCEWLRHHAATDLPRHRSAMVFDCLHARGKVPPRAPVLRQAQWD